MPILTTIDPNVMYMALLAGLWISVTAAYIPGTGIAEVVGFTLLVGSFIALTTLSTQWLAVVALVIGVAAFLILPFIGKRYANFAEIGLIGQAIGAYFLFTDMRVSPIVIISTLIFAVIYNRAVLIPLMKNQHERSEFDEAQQVLGVRGRVVKDLDPVGTVYVNKELWRARSEHEDLLKDTPIIVVAQEGLELIVEKSKRDDAPDYARLRLNETDKQEKPSKNGAKASK